VRFRLFAALPVLAAALGFALLPGSARAEPSSWLAVGSGYALERNGVQNYDARAPVLSISVGVGTTAKNPIVIGGLARMTTYFSLGTDLGVGLRVASRGFARGDWGVALDGGVVGRWWGQQDYGHFPIQLNATLGMPWGLNVGVGTTLWDVSGDHPRASAIFAVIEIDFLRATIMRLGAPASRWPNLSPVDAEPPATAATR
jgi:hypothetical protein